MISKSKKISRISVAFNLQTRQITNKLQTSSQENLSNAFDQGRRSFFMVGGLSKNVDHHDWPTTKNVLKQPPKKQNLDQNIKKISYLEFFFRKDYFGHTKFLYLSRRSSGYHQSFFLISGFLAESLKANKN